MKNTLVKLAVLISISLLGATAFAAPRNHQPDSSSKQTQPVPAFPSTLVNARYVYVTSYDGDQFDTNLLPEDRQAINTVQDSIQKWGKWTLVYDPGKADIVLMVTSRPTEDILAVYDGFGWTRGTNQYLWRMMGRSGLQPSESPLVSDLESAFETAQASR